MFDVIEGKVIDIEVNYVCISTSGIGFKVFVPNPYSFRLDEEVKVYLHNQIKEDEYSLYGFKSKEERNIFLKLINVKGLGPKIALPILAGSTVEGLMDAIERENVLYLEKFPKVGEKLARQIILDLKGKLVSKENSSSGVNDELIEVLLSLGYKRPDINRVVKDVDGSISIESQIKEALKLLLK
ncbi:MAG: Holliday junction branch migration protein RuvA [Tenericutes bacterium]|nr:Holliday junction branch migration protein RuvA [Mycoplasmatota bacterium]